MVRYPIALRAGKKIHMKSADDLIRNYDKIFTKKLKIAVAAQDPTKLFCNYQGAMIHDGEIWIDSDQDGNFRIIAFNPPVPKRARK